MKVLLVNPNRYSDPPVPPIGLEYLAGSLEKGGHAAEVVDLCFSRNIYKDLDVALNSFSPDVIGVSVRNIDSVLYHTNEFFLGEIKDIVNYLKSEYGATVILGGSGISVNPKGVLEYLEADFAISGPAEDTIHECLDEIQNSPETRKIFYGRHNAGIKCIRRTDVTDYKRYFEAGGIAGFETHKGCSSSCVYCIEANSWVSFKRVEDVIDEIKTFVKMEYNHFHICDSEFNEDLDCSIDFCNALRNEELDIKWAVYMKPSNYNKKLFRLMKATGAYLITLTVDSFKKCPQYWEDIEKIIFIAKSIGITVVVDFLTGFPYEDGDLLQWCLDLFRRLQPERVNINTYIRLYTSLQITGIVMNDEKLCGYLLGYMNDEKLIRPVFYNQVSTDELKELIDGDKLFRIAGPGKGINYREYV